ncbi:MAG: hypothetical protein AAGJ46_04625 [Planctomycetota bacterium]
MAKSTTGAKKKKPAASSARSPKKKATAKSSKATETEATEATIDRRRKPRRTEKAEKPEPITEETGAGPKLERRKKVNRRRQIDPTTCERDYSDQEVEFMNALDDYKRASGRMFPTCSEVLEVIRSLGYVKLSAAELAARAENDADGDAEAEDSALSGEAATADAQSEASEEELEPAAV